MNPNIFPQGFQGVPGGLSFPPAGPFPAFPTQGPFGNMMSGMNMGMMPGLNEAQLQQDQQQQQQQQQQRSHGIYYKTRLCNDFKSGWCKNGDQCRYAHGEHDLRKPVPEALTTSGPGSGRAHAEKGGSEAGEPSTLEYSRKTKLCQEFMNTGSCRYGPRCNFAHGQHELRQPGPGAGNNNTAGMFRPSGMPMVMAPTPPPMAPPPSVSAAAPPPAAAPSSAAFLQQQARLQPSRKPITQTSQEHSAAPAAVPQATTTADQNAPPKREEVTYVDRVRAVCGMLKIGNAASAEHRLAAQGAAIGAIKSGVVFRANPFADDVESYLPARTTPAGNAAPAAPSSLPLLKGGTSAPATASAQG
ncbi:hypothetical protein CEUSTIGMA_g6193.t1 [Chlamydomonas eustigma]|uniref:C3H1-type domain-containing protein n=1 Tax=Chlamydomonas eustigma TaxID=1157962 RepID=A0A250X6T8_9CHLO|nr:hypothetical protein CEUSTIGMA_g6193.t1 [Chlamydomonas eustigma]|eukprot:GAX78756.1 hypothetical protein CEUSTIGMA_g6193.t1 [Chlamydomonas eustigma]